jgi:hypothetical protein
MKDIKSIFKIFKEYLIKDEFDHMKKFVINDTDFYVQKVGSGTIIRIRIRPDRKVPDPTDPDLHH